MLRPFATLLLFAALLLIPAAPMLADADAVRDTVVSAYVEGIHINQDPDAVRAGFHPDFVMAILRDDKIVKVTRDEWIARIESARAERPETKRPDIRHEFTLVDHTGSAAVARVELYRDGVHTFTDYLSLYRFNDGWKIVGKIFYSHPE